MSADSYMFWSIVFGAEPRLTRFCSTKLATYIHGCSLTFKRLKYFRITRTQCTKLLFPGGCGRTLELVLWTCAIQIQYNTARCEISPSLAITRNTTRCNINLPFEIFIIFGDLYLYQSNIFDGPFIAKIVSR